MFHNIPYLAAQGLNSLSLSMNLFTVAAGLTLIFGVLRIINFAHGSFYMLGAYVTYSVVGALPPLAGNGFWLAVLAASLTLALVSYLIERLLLRRLYEKEHLTQILFTFGLTLVFADVIKFVWGSDPRAVPYPRGLDGAVDLGVTAYPIYPLLMCAIGPLLVCVMWWVIQKTHWGRIVRAARADREMLGALGINVEKIYSTVFVVGSGLAGFAGALASPRAALVPGMDALVIIQCFVIVIIGGLGSMWGSFLGAIILGVTTLVGTVFFPNWEIVIIYVVMLAVLLVRPHGLFGRAAKERD